jgi:hypothetical protein
MAYRLLVYKFVGKFKRDIHVVMETLGNFENPENKEADQDGLQGDLDFTERRSSVETMEFGTNNEKQLFFMYFKPMLSTS